MADNTTTNTECIRIADQLTRAFEGEAWHGPALKELLSDVTGEEAAARPVAAGHSIWELVLHIEVWAHVSAEAIRGVPMPKIVNTPRDWPPAAEGDAAWTEAKNNLFRTGAELAQAMRGFADSRFQEIVPGRSYDFYRLFHGIVQHSLYHGGQIAILKKALQTPS